MKGFFNKFLDVLSYIFSKLSYLIIIVVLGLFVFSRLNNLFDVGIINQENFISKTLNLTVDQEETSSGPAKIIYKGGKPSAQDIEAEEEFARNKGNLVSFEIGPNQSIDQICQTLLDKGLIVDPPSFKMMLETTNMADKIEPGKYDVAADIRNRDLISEITHTELVNEEISSRPVEGDSNIDLVSFEILEDDDPRQVAEKLRELGLIQDVATFLNLLEDANLLEEIKAGKYRLPRNIKNLDLIESITIAAP